MRYEVRLSNIRSYAQLESNGDEIYIKHDKNKIFPLHAKYANITSGDGSVKVNVNIDIYQLPHWIELELWEYNTIIPDVLLGTFKLYANEVGGSFITDLVRKDRKHEVRYQLQWELFSKRMTTIL